MAGGWQLLAAYGSLRYGGEHSEQLGPVGRILPHIEEGNLPSHLIQPPCTTTSQLANHEHT